MQKECSTFACAKVLWKKKKIHDVPQGIHWDERNIAKPQGENWWVAINLTVVPKGTGLSL